ncbi:MAG TPA: hypothetical protein VNK95_11815 [Caldilineaceae bacterium]|nr:hypothetical protein [Caldilineaceae bacterium]
MLIKADFHLHTYHSDNRDRMTPQEYTTLARALGYHVLGFCDHHHNLTQTAWETLRDEVGALASDGLLLTAGYEATWVRGHLCVLGKQVFDGEQIAACRRQMWSPANTRILAHPDNNPCAWLLPLPVGIQAVEVINGGQDLYAHHMTSPCNGLATYRRYLLLNHPVGAVGQSDCHARADFGRVWTGLELTEDGPLAWEAVQAALHARHSFAAMGDLPVRFWAENGAQMGDSLNDPACQELLWEVPPGAEATVWGIDRPLAYFGPADSGQGRYRLCGNGPHWLLVKRGLAWAVTSPIWVENRPGDVAAVRSRLAADSSVQRAADLLRRRLDWLAALRDSWPASPMPVAHYATWLAGLLPEAWPGCDAAFNEGADPAALAHARLAEAQRILLPLLEGLIRLAEQGGSAAMPAPRVTVAAAAPPLPPGPLQFTVDVPRDWQAIELIDGDGQVVPCQIQEVPGQRDPIHSFRSREQLAELFTWLAHGEMHEYILRETTVRREGSTLYVQGDLYPEALGVTPQPDPAAASALEAALAAPGVERFHVHLRMPRRFLVVLYLAGETGASRRSFQVRQAAAPPPEPPAFTLYADPAMACLAVQTA